MSVTKVAVVSGGPSSEAEVSRTGARSVVAALSAAGFEVQAFELDRNLPSALSQAAVDVVFPVTHGAMGEDGCLQGLLEVLGLPYVGSEVLASALAMDKPRAKVAFAARGLPLAPGVVVRRGDAAALGSAQLRRELGPALVVKPAAGGSAIGVVPVTASEPDTALAAAIERVLETDPEALVETAVSGVDVTCSVLEDERGPRALPLTLIRPKAAEFYDFASKYRAGGSEHVCPAPLAPELSARIAQVGVEAHRALGCRDLSRVDFVLCEADHEFVLLEVNTLPGMTATSLFPEAAKASGIGFEDLCAGFVRRALARPRRTAPVALAMP